MNYGEEYAFWYLRLNGFFPITNFVIHKSGKIEHSSDCDILAVRPPWVYEEVGGKNEDWDEYLLNNFDLSKTIGIICEVKTGDYKKDKLFSLPNLRYCIGRLGFVPVQQIDDLSDYLYSHSVVTINNNYQVGKILIAENGNNTEKYLFYSLGQTIAFLRDRIKRYPNEKYRDRMFFGSILFQSVIDRVVLERK